MAVTNGRFDPTRWNEEVYDDAEGAKLLRVSNANPTDSRFTIDTALHALRRVCWVRAGGRSRATTTPGVRGQARAAASWVRARWGFVGHRRVHSLGRPHHRGPLHDPHVRETIWKRPRPGIRKIITARPTSTAPYAKVREV
jgi:hypothetical protein